jgi:hypothetical protein
MNMEREAWTRGNVGDVIYKGYSTNARSSYDMTRHRHMTQGTLLIRIRIKIKGKPSGRIS